MSVPWTVTIDCADPPTVAAFWKEALGYVDAPPPEGHDTWEDWLRHFGVPEEEWDDGASLHDPDGVGPRISFLKVPEPKVAKNRLHIDIQAGGGRRQPWEHPLAAGDRDGRAARCCRCERDPGGHARWKAGSRGDG